QQKDREVACFNRHSIWCCSYKHCCVAHGVDVPMELANSWIDCDTGANVKRVSRPIRRLLRSSSLACRVELCHQVRSLNRVEALDSGGCRLNLQVVSRSFCGRNRFRSGAGKTSNHQTQDQELS